MVCHSTVLGQLPLVLDDTVDMENRISVVQLRVRSYHFDAESGSRPNRTSRCTLLVGSELYRYSFCSISAV